MGSLRALIGCPTLVITGRAKPAPVHHLVRFRLLYHQTTKGNKMKTITIYGASDDLIEVDGDCAGCDEYNARMHGILAGTLHLEDGKNHIRVHCVYDGSWSFAVCPQDGDCDNMPFPINYSFGDKSPYSWTVRIDVTDNCKVIYV
jgi:hypothetical protein